MSDDHAEILALIHANRIGIWMRDYDTWAACFVHAPHTTRWGWWRQGGVFHRRGWDDISARLQREFVNRPDKHPAMAYDTTVENLQLRIMGDMAWATFEQHYPGDGFAGYEGPWIVEEMRVFERHQGEWKIAFIGFLDGSSSYATGVIRLDVDGTLLDTSGAAVTRLQDDDDLVVRAGRLRLRNRDADEQLQAALRWASTMDGAYMSSHGAVPIVVEAGEGLQTRVFWVVADAGFIYFSFGETRVAENRLQAAALIYGLSPAQTDVARLVAEGLSLAEIAGQLDVSVNTARTHLNRVFDKIGVRTKPALVRALLSAIAPI